jgi:hypothetical protein
VESSQGSSLSIKAGFDAESKTPAKKFDFPEEDLELDF